MTQEEILVDESIVTAEQNLQNLTERILARIQEPEKLPALGSDEDFERMTKEAGLTAETFIDSDNEQWRHTINTRRQGIDRINTGIRKIMRDTHTALTSATVRRQSFVAERRLIDSGCKPYDFLPREVWRQFGLYYTEENRSYDQAENRKQQLTDEKGADLVAIRFDDPHFISYATYFEDIVNDLGRAFNAYNKFMQADDTKHLICITERLPTAITTTFQLYYIKLKIDIDYAKSRGISDWGNIGQNYTGDDLVSRTTDIEVYQEYPRAYRYGTLGHEIYNYIDYLNTKEWEYQQLLKKSGEKDGWTLKRLFASNSDADILEQFFLLDRLIQDFEYHEQYSYQQTQN